MGSFARCSIGLIATVTAGLAACCGDPVSVSSPGAMLAQAGTGSPTVSSVAPDSVPRNITLDVTVNGSNFDRSAQVAIVLADGTPVVGITTNSTTFITARKLVANLTILAGTAPSTYDVAVTLASNKRGVGIELFTVLPLTDLGTLGGVSAQATALNNLGHVVGWSSQVSGNAGAFFWSSGGMEALGSLAGTDNARAEAINDLDQVVGASCATVSYVCHGVLWERQGGAWVGVEVPLQTLDNVIRLRAITTRGEIFGNDPRPVRWTRAGGDFIREDLPLPSGRSSGSVVSANNSGQAVGDDLLWSFESGTVFLLQLPAPAGGQRPVAATVADVGPTGDLMIGGSATFGGNPQAVRWTLRKTSGQWGVLKVEVPYLNYKAGNLFPNYSAGRGTNPAGDLVGWGLTNGRFQVPVRWMASGISGRLPTPKGSSGQGMALAINNSAWIAGWYATSSVSGPTRAALWRLP